MNEVLKALGSCKNLTVLDLSHNTLKMQDYS